MSTCVSSKNQAIRKGMFPKSSQIIFFVLYAYYKQNTLFCLNTLSLPRAERLTKILHCIVKIATCVQQMCGNLCRINPADESKNRPIFAYLNETLTT